MSLDVYPAPSLPAGNNNIGDVDVATLPALVASSANIGDVDVLTLPAIPTGANVIGAVTQSGTWTVQPGNTANTTAWLIVPFLAPTGTAGTASGNINVTRTTTTSTNTNTSLVSAPGSGSIYVTDMVASNSGASLTVVTFKDGTTAKWDMALAASGGGGTINLGTPWKLTAATALQFDNSVASTTVYISVSYYYGA